MNDFDLLRIVFFAHGGGGKGGPPDFVAPVLIGCTLLLFGAAAIALGMWTRSVGSLGIGTILSTFGYGVAATTLGWPGSGEAFTVAGSVVAAFCAFLPWQVWRGWLRPSAASLRDDPWATPEEKLGKWLLPGERLLWTGAPDPRAFRGEAWMHTLAGAVLFGGGMGFASLMAWLIHKHGVKPQNIVGVVIIYELLAALALLGFFLLFAPRTLSGRLKDVSYGLTDRRGLVWAPTYPIWNPVPLKKSDTARPTEFSPWEMLTRKKVGRAHGCADLVFATEVVPGGRRGEAITYGFLGLPDPATAEALIEKEFRRSADGKA